MLDYATRSILVQILMVPQTQQLSCETETENDICSVIGMLGVSIFAPDVHGALLFIGGPQ